MISSTARMIDSKVIIPQQNKSHILKNLRISLSILEEEYKTLAEISNDEKQWQALSEKQKIENERAKILIIQSINEKINQYYGEYKHHINVVEVNNNKTALGYKILLFGWVIVDLVLGLMGGYMGFTKILNLMIPCIASLTVTLIASFFTAVEATMSYSVHKPMLQKALGIPQTKPEEILVNDYDERINLINEVNKKMMNIRYINEKTLNSIVIL